MSPFEEEDRAVADDLSWVEGLLASYEAWPVTYRAMPGMMVRFAVPEGTMHEAVGPRVHAFVLVEGPRGGPLGVHGVGAYCPGEDMGQLTANTGMDLARRWHSGETLWLQTLKAVDLRMTRLLKPFEARVLERLRTLARGTLPRTGFSPGFVEALACLDGFVSRQAGNWIELFGTDGAAAALRAFALRHPLVAEVSLNQALASVRRHGEVVPGDLCRGLDAARCRRLSAPAWGRHAYGDLKHPFSGPMMRIGGPPDLLRLARDVPVEWLPDDEAGVRAFLDIAGCVADLGKAMGSPGDLVRTAKGDWPAFVGRCVEGVPHKEGNGLHELREHLKSAAEDIGLRLVLPLLAKSGNWKGYDPAVLGGWLLYGDKALPACRETALDWHRHLPDIMAAVPDEGDDDPTPWPSHLKVTEFSHGVTAVPLLTGLGIREEGASGEDRNGVPGLAHCVGSYRARARQGHCHIVSFRGEGTGGRPYTRLATAEYTQDWAGRLRIVQVAGARNAEAPLEGGLAAQRFAELRIPMMPRRDSRTGDPVRDACGYDWSDPALLDRACAAYAPLLRRDLRGGHGAVTGYLMARLADAA